jgi:hypothetical protein
LNSEIKDHPDPGKHIGLVPFASVSQYLEVKYLFGPTICFGVKLTKNCQRFAMMLSGDGRDAWYRNLCHLSRHRGLLHTHPLLQVHVQTLQFENPLLGPKEIRVESATLFFLHIRMHCHLYYNPIVIVASLPH